MTKLISWLKLTKYKRWLMKDFVISYYATLPKWGLFMIWYHSYIPFVSMVPSMRFSDRAYGFFNVDDTIDDGAICTARKAWISKIGKYQATSSQISFLSQRYSHGNWKSISILKNLHSNYLQFCINLLVNFTKKVVNFSTVSIVFSAYQQNLKAQ